MTPERWQQLQGLLGAALERPVEERGGYVAGVCSGDADLQRELESLLANVSQGSGFLSTPAAAVLSTATTTAAAATLLGRTISGRYHVKSRLGAGGMGDVYLAEDAQLRCTVALKAVRESEPTPEGRAKLLREARAAAALRDHSNIAAIYDVLDSDDAGTPPLIVMEYVEGQTLSDRIRGGRLPIGDALRFARDIADALAAAHRRGIVHRDLKPANLRVTKDGRIKVLDFGLARRIVSAAPTDTSTMTSDRSFETLVPRIAGTPGYMAPEALLGHPTGAASDIFSFGAVLFEMISGVRPVAGDDFFSATQALLARPIPHLSDVAPGVPPAIDALVARMLNVDAAKRPTASEVLAELDALSPESQRALAASAPRSRRIPVLAALAALVIAVAAGIAWWRTSHSIRPERPAIAVLPLENLSGDPSKDYLGIGIAETLTTSLARLPAVSVIARTALADARKNSDVQTIARDVGATLLLEGSVQQSGDRLRVNAKLVRPDGSVTWAGEADSTINDLFTLETRLAESVLGGLSVNVSAADRQNAIAPPTSNQQALEAYWQGLAFLDRGEPGLPLAVASLEKATTIDRNFAAAFGALGETYRRQYSATNDGAWIEKATNAIQRGLAIDPGRTEVRISLATLYGQTGRFDEAARELRTLVNQFPDNDDARVRLAVVLNRSGHPEEALPQFQAATTLRPQYWQNHQQLGLFYFSQQRMQEAVAEFTRVIELRPDDANAYLQRGAALQSLGDVIKARSDYERSIAMDPNAAAYANLGTLELIAGRYEAAVRALTTAIKLRPKRAIYHRNLGDAYRKLKRETDARTEYLTGIGLLEDGLRVNPNDAAQLALLGVYEAKLGRAQDARQHSDHAMALNGRNADVLFRRGVTFALLGDTSSAMLALKDAVDRGYPAAQLPGEDDLSPLRKMPEFRKLTQSKR